MNYKDERVCQRPRRQFYLERITHEVDPHLEMAQIHRETFQKRSCSFV